MEKIALTEPIIKLLKPGTYRDTNLYLKVLPNGKKSFYKILKHNNSKKVIGTYPNLSIHEAKQKAYEDIQYETFGQLLKRVKKYQNNILLKTQEEVDNSWKIFDVQGCNYLKAILQTDIYQKNLLHLLMQNLKYIEKTRGPSAARKTYQKIVNVLKTANSNALIDIKYDNLCIIKKQISSEKPRQLYIQSGEQMKALLSALNTSDYKDVFIIALLTCARIGDVLAMRWIDIDLKNKKWAYTSQKQNEKVYIPLSNKVIEILKCANNTNKQVFDVKYRKIIYEWSKITTQLPNELKNLHIHDLRRTHLHWANIGDFAVKQHTLGHKTNIGATGVYDSNASIFEIRKTIVQNLADKIFAGEKS